MSNSTKKVVLGIVAVIAGFWAIKVLLAMVVGLVFKVILPVAVIGAIGYGVYHAVGRKSLGGGSRRTLP